MAKDTATSARKNTRHAQTTPETTIVEVLDDRTPEQKHLNWRLRYDACTNHIRALTSGRDDIHCALLRLWGLEEEKRDREILEVIRDVGRFLISQNHPELWRLLYLHLQASQHASDAITNAFTVNGYVELDEWRFLFGRMWKIRHMQMEEDTDADARLRRHLDSDPDE